MQNVYFDLMEAFNADGPVVALASGQAVLPRHHDEQGWRAYARLTTSVCEPAGEQAASGVEQARLRRGYRGTPVLAVQ
jgi:hypothetical protein